jgi:hypothetical protein
VADTNGASGNEHGEGQWPPSGRGAGQGQTIRRVPALSSATSTPWARVEAGLDNLIRRRLPARGGRRTTYRRQFIATEATWRPREKHGRLTAQGDLPDTVFAFPRQRKEPLTDAAHVRDAVARFDQVIGVSDADRALAFANIQKAAQYYGPNLSETDWHQLGVRPQQSRKAAAAKAAATRRARADGATT